MHVVDEYYPYYRKLVSRELTEVVTSTPEYKVLSERYPHLTQILLLKREKRRIEHELRSLKRRSTILQKKKINAIEMKLRRENILSRLYGEKKKETRFNLRFKYDARKTRVSSQVRVLTTLCQNKLRRGRAHFRSFDQALRRSLRKRLPPTLEDPGSMYMAEKGLAVREWINKKMLFSN
jgi:hypothetical protein